MRTRLAAALLAVAALLAACGGADDSADVVVTAAGPTEAVAPGSVAEFTMTVANNGPDDLFDVLVTNVLDSRLTLQGVSCTASGGARCPGSPDIGMTIPSLPAGGSVLISVRALVPAGTGGLVFNSMSTRSIPEDGNLDNNTATASAVIANAQLLVVYSAGDGIAPAGGNASFTAVVSNVGTGTATDVQLAYTVPAGTTVGTVGCEATGGALCPADLAANPMLAPSLPVGGTLLLRIPVLAPADLRGEIQSDFSATSAGDTDPGDSTASAVYTIVAPSAKLAVAHQVAAATVAGTSATFSARVMNLSTDPASNVQLTQSLPAGLTASSVTCSVPDESNAAAACPASTGTAMTLPSLPAGGILVFNYQVPVPLAAAGSDLTATFQATSDTDPANSDNTRSATTTVLAPNADLRATHIVQANTQAGTPVLFTATVTNLGPDTARGVVVRDTFSGGVMPDSIVCTAVGGATCPATTGAQMAVGTMPAGSSLRFIASVTAGAAGSSLSGTVSAEADGDANPANDTATATTSVVAPPANLSSAMSAPAVTGTGDEAVFTARVSNGGPNTATNLVLDFTLTAPAGIALADVSCSASAGATCPATVGAPSQVSALPAGAWLQFQYVVPVPAGAVPGGVISAEFSASADADPATGNNVASASSTINAAAANIAVSQSVAAETPSGEAAAFVALVSNQGPKTASNVLLAYTAPAGGSLSCVALGGAACPALDDPTAIAVPALPVGASLRLVLSLPTTGLAVGDTLDVGLTATYAGDPIADDNTAQSSTAVAAAADPNNGEYLAYAADGRSYRLLLDFDAGTYEFTGGEQTLDGSFTGPDGDGNYTIGGAARFRLGTDIVVGGFDFGAGVLPFVAAREFVTSVAELLDGGMGRMTWMGRTAGSGGVLSRYLGAGATTTQLRVCNSNTFYAIDFCPDGETLTYALSVSGNRFNATTDDPAQSITFRVARSGDQLVLLRAAAALDDSSRWLFQLGLPDTAGPTGGTFWGATTAGAWGLTTLSGTPVTYSFNGTASDSAVLNVQLASGPTGVRAGTRSSDSAGVLLMQVGDVSVLVGGRNSPASGHLEIGLAP